MKKYYLAYGSNLNVQQMRYRCPDATIFGTAEIPDYQLLFKGSMTGSYLTIEKKEGSTVPVAVWEVSERDEQNLDVYEGCPNFYYKTEMELPVKIMKNGGTKTVKAFVYIMHEERKLGIPSRAYLQTCLIGYRHFGFKPALLMKAIAVSEGGAI
ncbi:MAG: gamma-glutamylcyclotransferase [Ruminococcus sp.]|nr:gamma-glutamylcyclotransferase [Ruminococcus sp.]